jgi:ABC-type multidrug transport system fused ATPase/permease subunit
MIESYFHQEGASATLSLFFGVRTREEVYLAEEFKEFAAKYPNFTFKICLSREESLTGLDEAHFFHRSNQLSGGQIQRVAIARAILKGAPILVLDEATSSLDSESEYYIQDALHNLMRGKTTIVIAHRLSTIMQMDRIIVLDGGKIIEEGKHEELVKAQSGTYQKLWHIQAGGFAEAAG